MRTHQRQESLFVRDKSEQTISSFLEELHCIDWSNLDGYNDPKICYSKFLQRYTSLCDAGYVGYTCRHLHQRIEEHKGSAIGNHLREQHDMEPEDIAQSFRILRKCQNKFDCLIFEMFFIQELKPTLNKQCDSIRAKLFV